jgi:hypothetical protein
MKNSHQHISTKKLWLCLTDIVLMILTVLVNHNLPIALIILYLLLGTLYHIVSLLRKNVRNIQDQVLWTIYLGFYHSHMGNLSYLNEFKYALLTIAVSRVTIDMGRFLKSFIEELAKEKLANKEKR